MYKRQSESLSGFATAFSNFTGFWYNFTFFILIVAFTYFYTAITVNPMQMSEDMKKNGGFIPGVKQLCIRDRQTLMKEFGYKSVMQAPRLEKIVINQGVGSAIQEMCIRDSFRF